MFFSCLFFPFCPLLFFSKMSCYRDWAHPAHFLRHPVSPKTPCLSEERHLGNASATPPMTKQAAPDQNKPGQGTDLLRQIDSVGRERKATPRALFAGCELARLLPALLALPCPLVKRPCHRNRLFVMPDDQDCWHRLPVCLYIDESLVGQSNLGDL
ncbi:hypothetical protein J3F84DRAFT_390278 [Trichoderma pleuroticola]